MFSSKRLLGVLGRGRDGRILKMSETTGPSFSPHTEGENRILQTVPSPWGQRYLLPAFTKEANIGCGGREHALFTYTTQIYIQYTQYT